MKSFDRIRDSRGFDRVYKNTDKVWHTPYFVLFFRGDDKLRNVGFVAGKKVGNAVNRNRAKRLLRALFLQNINNISSGQYVFVAKAKILDEDFIDLSNSFKHTLKRTRTLLSKR